MSDYIVSLKDRKQVAEGTMAFYFSKPASFEFASGQSIDLTLIDPADICGRQQTGPVSGVRASRGRFDGCNTHARHSLQARSQNHAARY